MGKIVYGFKSEILPLSKKDDTKTDSGDQQPVIFSHNRKGLMYS